MNFYGKLIADDEGNTYAIEQWLVEDLVRNRGTVSEHQLFNRIGQELDIYLASPNYFKKPPFMKIGHVNVR